MTTYNFEKNFHGDIIISFKKDKYNLGSNYTCLQPIFSWLVHAQFTGENLFKDLKITHDEEVDFSKIDNNFNGYLEEAIELKSKLPLSDIAYFIVESPIWYINNFQDGTNKLFYKWNVKSNGLELLCDSPEGEIFLFNLNYEEHKKFALTHANYVINEKNELGFYCQAYRKLISILQKFN